MFDREIFISHASEDKDAFVRPLANAFDGLGVTVWYDEFSLSVGDSLSASIDKGLRETRYGLVVISKSFIKKPWPEYEFRSLVALESGKRKRILPVWWDVSRDEVLEFSPHLADKYALVVGERTPLHVAVEIMRIAAPEKFRELARRLAALKAEEDRKEWVPIGQLVQWPTLREPLTQPQLQRVRLIHNALLEVHPQTWEKAVADFQRDHPDFREEEIRVWERIAGVFLSVSNRHSLVGEQKRELFRCLIGWSFAADGVQLEGRPDWIQAAYREYTERLPNAKE